MTLDADQARDASDVEQAVEADIGGVQGGEAPSEQADIGQAAPLGQTLDQPAPDGAEIEWAGGVVRKPPAPQGGGS